MATRSPVADTISLQSTARKSKANNSNGGKHHLIFYITGNPGLIGYYDEFLSHLFGLLHNQPQPTQRNDSKAAPTQPTFDIYGSSIPGFEVTANDHRQRWKACGLKHAPPFSLNEVITAIEHDLWRVAAKARYDGIIIMGHSLGGYITLELISRHRRRLSTELDKERLRPPLISGIGLFATVVDIAKSPRGRMLKTLANYVPLFKTTVPLLCNIILTMIPNFLISLIVSRIVLPNSPSAQAVTTSFLTSPNGVRQALFMGADEMQQIGPDTWDEEVWGAAKPSDHSVPRPKIYLYFGEDDHWVAESTKAELLRLRGRGGIGDETWRPRMEVDGNGVPHGFCISHSKPIAEKAAEYIAEAVRSLV